MNFSRVLGILSLAVVAFLLGDFVGLPFEGGTAGSTVGDDFEYEFEDGEEVVVVSEDEYYESESEQVEEEEYCFARKSDKNDGEITKDEITCMPEDRVFNSQFHRYEGEVGQKLGGIFPPKEFKIFHKSYNGDKGYILYHPDEPRYR